MQEEPWQKSKNRPVSGHLKQKPLDNRDLEVFCHFSAQLLITTSCELLVPRAMPVVSRQFLVRNRNRLKRASSVRNM